MVLVEGLGLTRIEESVEPLEEQEKEEKNKGRLLINNKILC